MHAASVATGSAHGCAAAADRVYCWGDNDLGQRGGADRARSSSALPLDLPDTVTALAAGLSHTCALLDTGRVRCWGGNYSGQLGDRSLDDRSSPSAVRLDAQFTAISALAYHTCGVTNSGTLHCWGNDTDGQLGAGRPVAECRWDELRFYCSDRPEGVAFGKSWRAVAAGGSHSCAIDVEARVHCWGSNRSGQLGGAAHERCRGPGGSQPCRRGPAPVNELQDIIAIGAGAAHTCALDGSGRVHCWGLNLHGQLGVVVDSQSAAPTVLNTSLRFAALTVGGYHSCAITVARALYCWGSDAHGELRGEARARCDGVPCARQPVRVVRAGVSAVTAGFGSTCMRRDNGQVTCWGRSEDAEQKPPRPSHANRQTSDGLQRAFATVRWSAAVLKRFLHRNLVAPLETL